MNQLPGQESRSCRVELWMLVIPSRVGITVSTQENLLNDIGHLWKSCINHIYQSREPVKEMGLCEAVIVGSALVVVRQGK